MKDVVLNKSWHLWLANFGDKRIDPAWGTDICQYTRAVLVGSFWACFAASFIGLFALWTGYTMYDIYQAIFNGSEMIPPTIVYIGILGILATMVVVAIIKEWWDTRPTKDAPPKPPSFAKVVYRKVKDKTCFRIRFQ